MLSAKEASDEEARFSSFADDAATSVHLDAGTAVSFIHDALQLLASAYQLSLVKLS